jgi:hypothetical protein
MTATSVEATEVLFGVGWHPGCSTGVGRAGRASRVHHSCDSGGARDVVGQDKERVLARDDSETESFAKSRYRIPNIRF